MGEVFFLLKTPLFSGKEAETGKQKVREKEREQRDPILKKIEWKRDNITA